MGIATADCEKTDLMSVRSGALVATFNIIWSTPTNVIIIWKSQDGFFKKNYQTRG